MDPNATVADFRYALTQARLLLEEIATVAVAEECEGEREEELDDWLAECDECLRALREWRGFAPARPLEELEVEQYEDAFTRACGVPE